MFSLCRTHYAGVLIWRGDWRQADIELRTAIKDLQQSRPGETAEALVKLAELRYRQGRTVEAEALLTRAESPPSRMLARVLAMPVRAYLALAGGDPLTAADYALRFLRAVRAEARMARVAGLDLLVRAHLALGDCSAAKAAADTPCHLDEVYLAELRDLLRAADHALLAGETTIQHHGPLRRPHDGREPVRHPYDPAGSRVGVGRSPSRRVCAPRMTSKGVERRAQMALPVVMDQL
jgi:ATP/maltotriose-dependent transcriptional regulator MalT